MMLIGFNKPGFMLALHNSQDRKYSSSSNSSSKHRNKSKKWQQSNGGNITYNMELQQAQQQWKYNTVVDESKTSRDSNICS